jgi:hypothetical protein
MIPPAVRQKLGKLLPLLGSDHDNEVIAAARAIGRTLAATGLDWHALAGAIQAWPVDAPVVGTPQPSSRPPASGDSAPSAPCSRPGMRLWDTKPVESWSSAAGYALMIDWTMPKAFGGRFLNKADRDRLRTFERSARVTNADAAWIEEVVGLAHKSAETWRTRGRPA